MDLGVICSTSVEGVCKTGLSTLSSSVFKSNKLGSLKVIDKQQPSELGELLVSPVTVSFKVIGETLFSMLSPSTC